MNIIGHLLIAASVRKMVLRQTGVRLSLPGFLYGNVLPDLSAKYGRNPHFFAQSLPYVLDCSRKLETDFRADGIPSLVFSRNAGVVTHYLSDFFCYAHSEQCAYRMYRHHWYEFCMLRQFRNGLLFCQAHKSELSPGNLALESFIRGCMDDYNTVCREKKQDFYFAVKVSSGAVIRVVRHARSHAGNRLPANLKAHLLALR